MKYLFYSTALLLSFCSCSKTSPVKPSNRLIGGTWIYLDDTTQGLRFADDSVTFTATGQSAAYSTHSDTLDIDQPIFSPLVYRISHDTLTTTNTKNGFVSTFKRFNN